MSMGHATVRMGEMVTPVTFTNQNSLSSSETFSKLQTLKSHYFLSPAALLFFKLRSITSASFFSSPRRRRSSFIKALLSSSISGLELCDHMGQDVPKSKTKSPVKPYLSRSSTLMKPTASYLAKHDQLEEFYCNHISRRFQKLLLKTNKSSQTSSMVENLATKRQKLEAGYLCKVFAFLKVLVFASVSSEASCSFVHKIPKKIHEAPPLPRPKKSSLQLTEFQVFQLRTSERARQHARNKVAPVYDYDYISQIETKDYKRFLRSSNGFEE
ncbi:hypothetical protein EZV62_008935 [Acer yangbiense]|uniref:TPX2 central domain-containing protein n=1 Tax=Acer yangbiense TaxID=1000413 RepID=A0A5C7IEC3_9ROSI|nr:hypothetical protein EZV62_008935 [Acer yangbiense]